MEFKARNALWVITATQNTAQLTTTHAKTRYKYYLAQFLCSIQNIHLSTTKYKSHKEAKRKNPNILTKEKHGSEFIKALEWLNSKLNSD